MCCEVHNQALPGFMVRVHLPVRLLLQSHTGLHAKHHHLQVSWLTPAEIFQPHYGQAVTTAIMRNRSAKQPLNIIEIGGGSGRLAKDILVCWH